METKEANPVASSGTIPADKTLMTFLCHAVAANRAERKTLTLVLPGTIALQPDFFCDLADGWTKLRKQLSIDEQTRLRIDCCSGNVRGGWIRGLVERIEMFRCHRAFAKRKIDDQISLTRCLVIGRPNEGESSIVLGVADETAKLPIWAKPAAMRLPKAK